MSDTTQLLLEQLNAVKVTPNDLWRLAADSEKYHRRNPDAEASFEAGLHLISRRVKKGDFCKAYAILCRMAALAKLVERGDAPAGRC